LLVDPNINTALGSGSGSAWTHFMVIECARDDDMLPIYKRVSDQARIFPMVKVFHQWSPQGNKRHDL
jgi:hypothetical protein